LAALVRYDAMTDVADSLDAEVRSAEPDLWLASRLVAKPAPRAALIALYALHVELAKVAVAARNPLAGEIRLAWWREEVQALFDGSRPHGHPALQALSGVLQPDRLAILAMIEARHAELEPTPFQDEAALVAYLDGVDGGLMRAAAALLAPAGGIEVTQTASAWGWARLLSERAAWRARGRDWMPAAWGQPSDTELVAHVRHRVADAIAAARVETAALPVGAFPAAAYAALAQPYARGVRPSALGKRARLLWASLRGRI
jgi:phytoene synthase